MVKKVSYKKSQKGKVLKSTKKQPKNIFLSILYACVFITIISLSLFNLALYSSSPTKGVLGLKIELDTKSALLQQEIFWKKILEENPTYFPGWIELAKVEIQLENLEAAKEALFEAKNINPNSEILKKIMDDLGFSSF